MNQILETSNLTIGYPRKVVAKDLNVRLKPGELVCLLGPNGAGKSTLIRTLCGMQSPLSGTVRLEGQDVHRMSAGDLAKRLSVVLTERIQGGLLRCRELVELGRYPYTGWSGKLTERDREVVAKAMTATGSEEFADRLYIELSDGEKQKIMVARALAQQPKVMVLDEVTAFLDLPRRVEIMRLLRGLASENNCAILLSTHDLDLALRSADQLWLLHKGGHLASGAPEDLVLSGTFGEAFRSEGVEFEMATGQFQLQDRWRGEIALSGSGVAAEWARRAVERAGYRVKAAAETELRSDGAGWSLRHRGADQTLGSLGAVVDTLRRDAAS